MADQKGKQPADAKAAPEADAAAAPAVVKKTPPAAPTVVIHPLVLLSCVDHYNRIASSTRNKRVVGVLLGEHSKGTVEVMNCYAVPFEEDEKNPHIWFLDHNYHEAMYRMYRKVTAKEQVIGWYSTGPKLRENDLEIHELMGQYHPRPVLVIVDVQQNEALEIPTKAYMAQPTVCEDGTSKLKFSHCPCAIGALEAEEVGVEHLLRDIKDTNISTLAQRVNTKLLGIKSLLERLHEMHNYLESVAAGRLPINPTIINNIQDIFNLLPNINVESIVQAFAVKTNDALLIIYLSSIVRAIIALHNLIDNKIALKKAEDEAAKPKAVRDREAKEKAEREAKEKADADAKLAKRKALGK